MIPFARTRPEDCLSDLAIDRLRAGEALPEAASHATGCERCRARVSAPRAFDEPMPRFRARRRVPWAVAGALAAAAAVLLVLRPHDTRTKGGGPRLGAFIKRAGQVSRLGPDDAIHPGDRLRFVVTLDRPRHVAVLSLDGAGHATVYAPPAPVAPGSEQALPGATLLDEVVGPERLFAVFCAAAFDAEPLRRSLEDSGALDPPGCEVETMTVAKTR